MNDSFSPSRQPWVAGGLSLLCTGLGHIYCGRLMKGLILFLISLLFWPVVAFASLSGPATWILAGIVAGPFAVICLYVYAAIDAFRCAKKSQGSPYEPRELNHGVVYTLFVLVGLIYPVGSAALVRANVVEAFYIPAASMSPSILKNDRILVNKIRFQSEDLRRGDVVVFRPPGQRTYRYVKRVIGLPGDKVVLRDQEIFVNGQPLQRDRLPASALTATGLEATGGVYHESNAGSRYMIMHSAEPREYTGQPEITVPEDQIFVLGDNRDRSRDSRDFGCVPLGDVLGPVVYIYLPAGSWSRFGAFDQ